MSAPVRYEVADRVATVTLDRPDTHNRLSAELLSALRAALLRAGDDPAVRVVVLAAAGPTFCAGADLSAVTEGSAESFAGSAARDLVAVLTTLLDLPKPVIARVQGAVAGGGLGLVAACDLAVAADAARFAFSEVRLGVAPAVVAVVCLPKFDRASAAELFLTGARWPADRLREAGLLNEVVPLADLDAVIREWARQLCLGGPNALAAAKALLRRVPALPRDEAFAWTAELSSALFASAEAAEGIAAYLGKRPAAWAPEQPAASPGPPSAGVANGS